MSIYTLKRKTQATYKNVSVDVRQFSLNGGHRSQGWIGQTSLSRSLPTTPMVGNTPKGHGGIYGVYPRGPIIQSAVISTNDPNVIKPSVLDNDGMIATKYRWIRRPYPYTTVKSDSNRNLTTQGDHIRIKRRQEICCTKSEPGPLKYCKMCDYLPTIFKPRINTAQSYAAPFPNTVTKAVSSYLPVSQGEYLDKADNCCVKIDVAFEQAKSGSKCGGNVAGYMATTY